jgi:hypothetical protein
LIELFKKSVSLVDHQLLGEKTLKNYFAKGKDFPGYK